jgi:hypothetical protein
VSAMVNLPNVDIISWRFWELLRGWAWAAPGLFVLALVGIRRQSRFSAAWILGITFWVVIVVYCFAPVDQGLGWGARYYQTAWGALPILAGLLLVRPGQEVLTRIVVVAALAGLVLVVPLQIGYAQGLAQQGQSSSAYIQSLEAPGVNLYFVRFDDLHDSSITLQNDPSLSGIAILASEGQDADRQVVDRWFPGARLVTSNSHGSGYARP